MRTTFNKQATGLSEVRLVNGNETRVTSDPQECCSEAANFYSRLYESRGENREEYRKWLTQRHPLTSPISDEEVPSTI